MLIVSNKKNRHPGPSQMGMLNWINFLIKFLKVCFTYWNLRGFRCIAAVYCLRIGHIVPYKGWGF